MIPLTVAIIGSSAKGSQARAFRNSLVYVGGIAICYSLLGVVVASVGGQFGAMFQSPIFLIAVAAMMLLLAGHMLEVRKLGFLLRLQGAAGDAAGQGGEQIAGAHLATIRRQPNNLPIRHLAHILLHQLN